jgi:hypothetical protein
MPLRLDQHASGATSQHGEEGMIRAVFDEIGVRSRTCVEFGAYDIERFSNVHSLWHDEGWRALLIEGDAARLKELRGQHEALPEDLRRRVTIARRFVTEDGPDRLDAILAEHGLPTDLDLLSIDVDGTDLHIWRGLERFRPRLVIVEYNATIPPHIDLVGAAGANHVSSSILALARLGAQKGYSLIGSIGWNAFFVEREHAHRFTDADDVEALFDRRHLRYAMQTLTGEIFFSGPPLVPYFPLFRTDSDAIERSSVDLDRMRYTPREVAEGAARGVLRPLRRRSERLRGRLRQGALERR